MNVDSKPLPPPLRDDLPPVPHHDNDLPPVPPHFAVDESPSLPPKGSGLAHIDTGALSPHDGLHVPPITPISPIDSSAPRSPGEDGRAKKKVNPLTDLIETEKVYVDLLTGIMRKVAAAWSRQNLPPPELDKMFRNIEAVYKANRALLAKLKEIGTNPSSPKALGDLLMRWIGDLDAPYTKYSETHTSGFDEWEPVQSNARLRTTLAMFSASNPPPLPPNAPEHPSEPPLWTLDSLFLLPKGRLRYYRKLYSRLLKSTTPGRTDHRLLTGALDKLDSLLTTLDNRASIKVGGPAQLAVETEDEVVIDLRTRNSTMPLATPSSRESDSIRSTDSPSANRSSQDTAPTSVSRESASSFTMPVSDLERRLSPDRCLDIFTMQPKAVKLQIAPPGLHYARELKASVDVVMQLVPRSTGVEVTQERGHVFILTDLLLMCERMTPEEKAAGGPDGPDMWLLYPPLAGKHLRVAPVDGSDTALSVTILRKETVTMYTNSRKERDHLVAEFLECIDRAALLIPGKGQQPPPPVPKLPPGAGGGPTMQRQPSFGPAPGEVFSGQTSPPSRVLSPSSMPPSRGQSPPVNGMARMGLAGEPPSRMPSLNSYPEGGFPPRSSSTGTSFSPGQVIPPGPGQIMPSAGFGPGQVMPPMHGGPMMNGPGPGPGQYMPPTRGTSFNAGPPGPYGPGQPGPSQGFPPQPGMPRMQSPYGPPGSRPPSEGSGGSLRKSTSSRSLASDFERRMGGPGGPPPPPMPGYPNDLAPPNRPFMQRSESTGSLSSLGVQQPRPLLPSAAFSMRSVSSFADPSPPTSPVEETPRDIGPTSSRISAQMKCKVFLKEHHAKWKSLGSAKLRLYHESPTNIKQLVVEADNSKKSVLISTIVLADGVERVGKTGVAIELSDRGQRTGVVYMLQLRNESSAGGLFESLLAGSDRSEVNSRT